MPEMVLYHFTASHLARKIKRQGIIKGCISVFDDHGDFLAVRPGWQWLTENPHFDQQSWNTRQLIRYDRCAVRFTVDIPADGASNLNPAIQVITDQFPNSLHLLRWPRSREWWLYQGKIFPRWIVACEESTTDQVRNLTKRMGEYGKR